MSEMPTPNHQFVTWQYSASNARTPYTAVFGESEANQTAHFIGRWVSTRGEAGPLGETLSATVPG